MKPASLRALPVLQWTLAAWLIASSTLISGCELGPSAASQSPPKPKLGLMTSLPIYWQESAEFGDLLSADAEPNWVRTALEKHHVLTPLDNLDAETLAPLDHLLLAQPRALSPQENVALDEWVRGGGRLLLFADPLLTQESRFALGDARAPQPVVLLSPILTRWGLELTFDEEQAEGERIGFAFDLSMPVNLAGGFRQTKGVSDAQCGISEGGLAAACRIGAGRATVIADAAALDTTVPSDETRRAQVEALIERSFSP